jgi:hypothetical protein
MPQVLGVRPIDVLAVGELERLAINLQEIHQLVQSMQANPSTTICEYTTCPHMAHCGIVLDVFDMGTVLNLQRKRPDRAASRCPFR